MRVNCKIVSMTKSADAMLDNLTNRCVSRRGERIENVEGILYGADE